MGRDCDPNLTTGHSDPLTAVAGVAMGKWFQLVPSGWALWCAQPGTIAQNLNHRQKLEWSRFLRRDPRKYWLMWSSKLQLRRTGASSCQDLWAWVYNRSSESGHQRSTHHPLPSLVEGCSQRAPPSFSWPALNTSRVDISATQGWPQAKRHRCKFWKSGPAALK